MVAQDTRLVARGISMVTKDMKMVAIGLRVSAMKSYLSYIILMCCFGLILNFQLIAMFSVNTAKLCVI